MYSDKYISFMNYLSQTSDCFFTFQRAACGVLSLSASD